MLHSTKSTNFSQVGYIIFSLLTKSLCGRIKWLRGPDLVLLLTVQPRYRHFIQNNNCASTSVTTQNCFEVLVEAKNKLWI